MKIFPVTLDAAEVQADALIIGHYEDQPGKKGGDGQPTEPAARLDEVSGGLLTRLMQRGEFEGKEKEVLSLYGVPGFRCEHVVLVGLGKAEGLDAGRLFQAAGAAANHLSGRQRQKVVAFFGDLDADLAPHAICGAMVGCQGQDLFRSSGNQHPFGELGWSAVSEAVVDKGHALGESVNLTRRLVNLPAGDLYPETFADEAAKVASAHGLTLEIWDEEKLAEEKCGALLGVAQGSERPPRLVMLKYEGGAGDQPQLGLVGKGVTFDSGGLSLKPSDGMKTMKSDMAGAATVLGAVNAIAASKIPVNVVGYMGLVENMINGRAYKLGDVLRSRNGKTIEVLNTDAEGRLVLADVLDVAVTTGSARLIDLATLTGACVVALGTDMAGLMTNDASWCRAVSEAAEHCGEPAWELPMLPAFAEQIRSEVADIKNIGEGRWGGAITAAKFLEEFVKDTPWTHVDIAGPAFQEKPNPWIRGGGTGTFVRTLVEIASRW